MKLILTLVEMTHRSLVVISRHLIKMCVLEMTYKFLSYFSPLD